MGYFALPPKSIEKCSVSELIDTAKSNLRLFENGTDYDEDYKKYDYLLSMAIGYLHDALDKINTGKDNDTNG